MSDSSDSGAPSGRPARSSNPFLAPDAASAPATTTDEIEEIRALVVGMRFPHLLLGGLYALGGFALLAFGGMAFLGSLAGPMTGDEQLVVRVIGALYAVTGALALLPAGLLLRSGLAAMTASHDPEQVVTSLRAQLWFWRLLALYVLGSTLLYGLAFFVFVGVGIVAGM